MSMELPMLWHPPLYISLSILGMLVFPLIVVPVLRRRDLWLTCAPVLIVLLPLFHGVTLAFLGLRSVFLGMTLAGTDSPIVLAAGLGEALRGIFLGSLFSGLTLLLVSVFAFRRAHSDSGVPSLGSAGRSVANTDGVMAHCGVVRGDRAKRHPSLTRAAMLSR